MGRVCRKGSQSEPPVVGRAVRNCGGRTSRSCRAEPSVLVYRGSRCGRVGALQPDRMVKCGERGFPFYAEGKTGGTAEIVHMRFSSRFL